MTYFKWGSIAGLFVMALAVPSGKPNFVSTLSQQGGTNSVEDPPSGVTNFVRQSNQSKGAVPIPGTLALFAAGVIALPWLRSKIKQ